MAIYFEILDREFNAIEIAKLFIFLLIILLIKNYFKIKILKLVEFDIYIFFISYINKPLRVDLILHNNIFYFSEKKISLIQINR